jgi:hypothetical protein
MPLVRREGIHRSIVAVPRERVLAGAIEPELLLELLPICSARFSHRAAVVWSPSSRANVARPPRGEHVALHLGDGNRSDSELAAVEWPLLIVLVAIGGVARLFALDSIPAVSR